MLGHALGLQIAQSRYYIQTLGVKVGTICILGALGVEFLLVFLGLWLLRHRALRAQELGASLPGGMSLQELGRPNL